MSSSTNTNNDGGGAGAGVTVAGPTAGPYRAEEGAQWVVISEPDNCIVCAVEGAERSLEEEEANAHLLASSWAFLAACTPKRLASLGHMIEERVRILSAHGWDADTDGLVCDGRALLSDLRAAVAGAGGGGRTT